MHEPREFQKIFRVPDKTNTFCYYPFYALVFKLYENDKLSKVAPCCMMHDTNQNTILEKSELQNLDPDQIFNHQKFVEFRNNILNNIKDPRCQTCWKLEENGFISHRMYTGWDFDEPFSTELREVDISLSNKCNLACRMCNIGSSHQLYKDLDEIKKLNLMEKFNYASDFSMNSKSLPKNTTNNLLFKWIFDNTDKIKVLKISGGEPFYDNNVIKLLQKFIKDGNSKNTRLVFHTNGILIDDSMIQILNKFKSQMHTFSIDGVDNTYNYIRHYSNFNVLEKNLINWFKKSNNIKSFNCNFVISALNLDNIIDFMDWIIMMFHLKIKCNIFFSSVRPIERGIHIRNLPVNHLIKIKSKFLKFYNFFEKIRQKEMGLKNHFFYESENIFQILDNSIENNFYEKNKFKLYDEITILDQARNQNYSDYVSKDLKEILDNLKK